MRHDQLATNPSPGQTGTTHVAAPFGPISLEGFLAKLHTGCDGHTWDTIQMDPDDDDGLPPFVPLRKRQVAGGELCHGFVITPRLLQSFLDDSGKSPQIRAAFAVLDLSTPRGLGLACELTRLMILNTAVPAPLLRAAMDCFEVVPGEKLHEPVVVTCWTDPTGTSATMDEPPTFRARVHHSGHLAHALRSGWASAFRPDVVTRRVRAGAAAIDAGCWMVMRSAAGEA